ncbi:hypothetical protein ACFFF5_10925 [Lederbergia wuyishanensis]|uniref:Uncharacterized protein n=1 Tax=Lederbergia wuyishanensis TaxID=1347903 RepID=A0ABU0D4I1_9BACI|nr:hypothetical protein [Lederbergia wuyishanensis]MCJ8008141.1 hypothetical protein [Lederbergia wuyishanensis]MDQ0343273.1 hypothetical protein [Lederbergia wuyishanensis]
MTNSNQKDMEQQLRDLPSFQLNKSSQDNIHKQLIKTVIHYEQKERKANIIKKLFASFAGVVAFSLVIFFTFTMIDGHFLNGNTDTKNHGANQGPDKTQNPPIKNTTEFNAEKAKELTTQYQQLFNSLAEEAKENNDKITSFASKAEIQQSFTGVLTEEFAASIVDSYFTEKDGNVFIIPKTGPAWLLDEDFTVTKVEDDHYIVTQEQDTLTYGHALVTYHFKYVDDNWLISKVEITNLDEKEIVRETAQEIMEDIDKLDMVKLSDYVHSEKGLLFSPYVFVNKESVVFQKDEISELLNNKNKYLWGYYDGNGDPIELTTSEYFAKFLSAEKFLKDGLVLVDDLKERGNIKNNIKDIFPQSKTVEYFLEGTQENDGMDRESIILVFEKDQNGIWKLVAIVNDGWTI